MLLPENNRALFEKYSPFDSKISTQMGDMLQEIGFFNVPASTKYHGCHDGGLFEHSFNVYLHLCKLTASHDLLWMRKESTFVIGILHDLCKVDSYTKTETGFTYRTDTLFGGHGEKSVMLCGMLPITLTEEEAACIRYHMGAFVEKDEWKYYTGAIHRYPNVLWTHMADMLATHVTEYNEGKVR